MTDIELINTEIRESNLESKIKMIIAREKLNKTLKEMYKGNKMSMSQEEIESLMNPTMEGIHHNTIGKELDVNFELDLLSDESWKKHGDMSPSVEEELKTEQATLNLYSLFEKEGPIRRALETVQNIIDYQIEYYKEIEHHDRLESNKIIKMYDKLLGSISTKSNDDIIIYIKNGIHEIDYNLELYRQHGEYSQIAMDFHFVMFKSVYVLYDLLEEARENING